MSINIINFNIRSVFFKCKGERENIVFELVKNKPVKYNKIIPDFDKDFLFLKILTCGKIIACEGKYANYLNIKKNTIINQNIRDIEVCQDFFTNYVIPIFEESLRTMDPYQFSFFSQKRKKKKEYKSCSFYPCFIPDDNKEKVSSVDLVIRPTKINLEKENISKFVI